MFDGDGSSRPTRVLLIDPTDPWVTNSTVLKHHEQVMLPIGLMSLSATLKQRLGGEVEVKVVSTLVDLEAPEDLDRILRAFAPDVVGIRCVIFYAERVKDIVERARRVRPAAVIVAGGPNVTADNLALRSNRAIDILAEGEGEDILADIVAAYREGGRAGLDGRLPEIGGVSYRRAGKLCRNGPRETRDDLDALPFPDYESIELDRYQRYLNYGYNRRKMGVLFTSRGCPFKCTYCHVVFGKAFRPRSADSTYEEIVALHDTYGIEDFAIVDDNFTVHRDRVKAFCKLMRQGPRVRLYFPNGVRADSLNEGLLEQMREAGMIYATYSLETASSRLQKLIKKHANIDKLARIVEHSCDLGIISNLAIMVGFPTETVDEALETLDFFERFDRIVLPYYFSVKYYPGTELFQTAGEYGIDINSGSYDAPYHGYEFQETPLITRRDFERLNQRYLRRVYLNPDRLRNAVGILRGHFDDREIADMFTLFFRRPVEDVDRDVVGLVSHA